MKKMFILSSLLLIIGCKKDTHKLLELRSPPFKKITFLNNYTLKISDTLNINLPDGIPPFSIGYGDFLKSDSTYYFSYENHKIASINLFENFVDSLIIPKEIVEGDIRAIYPITKDSIILIQDSPEKLILLKENKETEIIQLPKISFNTSNKWFNNVSNSLPENKANFLVGFNLIYDSKNSLVHVGLQPFDAYYSEGFENSARIAAFDLKTKKWKYTYAPPEGMMKYRGNHTYTSVLSEKNMFFKNDTMFVSYLNDHYIYYYKDSIYLGKFPHISANSENLFLPMSLGDLEDIEKSKKYIYAAPYYGSFNYHEKLKLFSRIYFSEQKPIDNKGKYNPYNLNRDIYAIFLDENFKHVGEFKFPPKSFEIENSIKPTSDGFILYSNDFNDKDTLNKTFKLKYVYKIEKIFK